MIKKKCKYNFNNSQLQNFLFQNNKYVEQVTAECCFVWEGGTFTIKTKKIDLKI